MSKVLLNSKIILAIFFVGLKSLGAVLFSYILIQYADELIHSNIMHDISLILAISIIARMGADQAILKYGGFLYEKNNHDYFKYLNSYFILTSLFLSFILNFLVINFYEFKSIDGYLSFLWGYSTSVLFIVSSYMKVVKKPHYSSLFETGSILFLACGAIYLLITFELKSYIYYVVPLSSVLFGAVGLLILKPNIPINIFKAPWCSDIKINQNMNDFTKSLPIFTLSSFFNYFTQWGVILLVTINFDNEFSSKFILMLRICVAFNVVMSLINSFDASKMYFIYNDGGAIELQKHINKYKKIYFFGGIIVFIILTVSIFLLKSHTNVKALSFELSMFILLSFSFAFNLSTGPASHCLAMLGNEKIVMYIRFIFSCFLIFVTFISNEYYYYYLFAFYMVMQKVVILFVLNKKYGIKTVYLT